MLGYLGIIITLFILVLYNNRRNQNKWRNRRKRNFRENYYQRRKDQNSSEE